MFRYAQLKENNIVMAISDLFSEVTADNMILINDMNVELGSAYDADTHTFKPPTVLPEEPQPTIEEKILAENQYQTMLLELNSVGGV